MEKTILNGRWFVVCSEKEHKNLLMYGDIKNCEMISCARCQIGNYIGPGKYMLLSYQQRCPRNCCYDDVHEVLSSLEVIEQVKEQITDLVEILKFARQ